MMKEFWNERYGTEEYVYGKLPNEYLKKKLEELPTGKILFVAEGEGRNSVYAATLGWQVSAFDQSAEGRKKAEKLAADRSTSIQYTVAGVEDLHYPAESFDVLVFIYSHFAEVKRRQYHRKLSGYLKRGGALILEGFHKDHQKYQAENPLAGGPRDPSMLYDSEELKNDFADFDLQEVYEGGVTLNEGGSHVGAARVVRLFGLKK